MPDLETTVRLAKGGSYSRAQTYSAICALAEQQRVPGESEHQAFTKYISGEGAELFRLCQSMPGRDIEPVWQAPINKGQPTAGDTHVPTSDWDGLVNGLMRSQKISRNRAITAALSSEEGRHLFRQQKRAEQISSGGFSADDMKMLDDINEEQEQHADLHKRANQYKSEFEHMVADVRRSQPHLSETVAQDFVRSSPRGMEAWLRHKGKPGQNGPHNMGYEENPTAATSGRTDPSRAPQWQSDHSGSSPVTPTRTPERPSEAPALKQWRNLKKKLMIETGWDEERAVMVLKCLPEGRRAIAAVIKAAEAAVQA